MKQCAAIVLFLICFSFFCPASTYGNNTSILEKSDTGRTYARPDVPGILLLDLGLNFLNDAEDNMKLNALRSKVFNIYYLYTIRIGESRFSVNPGIGLGLEKYAFDGRYMLATTPEEGVEIVSIDDVFGQVNVRKSKLTTSYVDIPLEIRYHINRDNFKKSIKVAVGAKAGVLFNSHMKVKYSEDGEKKIYKLKEKYDLNPFRYGVYGRVGIGSFNVFYYHGLSTLFKSGDAPGTTEPTQYNVGISFDVF